LVYIIQNQLENLKKIKLKIDRVSNKISENRIDKFMSLYSDYELGKKYLKFLSYELDKFTSQKLSKKLLLREALIRTWFNGAHPYCISSLLKIYNKKYHLIKKEILAYLIGYGFGDGGLKSNLLEFFMCGTKQDLKNIIKYLKKNINSALNIKFGTNYGGNVIRNKEGKLIPANFGESWIIYIYDSVFAKLLHVYGLPKGEKVLQEFLIPDWIKNSPNNIKKEFLEALFESELQKYTIIFNKKRKKIEICPISFGLAKIKEYQTNLIQLLDEIRGLCIDLGIKCGLCELPKLKTKRKDGNTTIFSRFYISMSALNVCKFADVIDFRFHKEKRLALDKAVKEAKRKLGLFNDRFMKYEEAINLYKKGLNYFKIAKELEVNYMVIRGWIKNEFKPYLFENADIVEEFLNGKNRA